MFWSVYDKAFRHSGIALRQSGCIDFYYAFRLVEESRPSFAESTQFLSQKKRKMKTDKEGNIKNAGNFCNITSDFGHLYFADEVNIYECGMNWKQDIGITVSKIMDVDEKIKRSKAIKKLWTQIEGNRVS